MRVGVLDVESNTIRLLVASVDNGVITPIEKERVRLPLGEEIERNGRVSTTRALSGTAHGSRSAS